MAKKDQSLLKDQSGAALVIALVMIIVLTLIALASTLSSNFENKLSGNKRGSTDCFYTADTGIQVALDNVSNFLPKLPDTTSYSADLTHLASPAELVNYKLARVNIHQTSSTGSPRGVHVSAAGNYGFAYFVIDSRGCDQLDISLVPFDCEQEEQVVRLLPTSQGGT